MKKQTVIEIGEDRKVNIRSFPQKLVAVIDAKALSGWLAYRDLLQKVKGIGETLVVTDRDAVPQSPYVDAKPYQEGVDLNTLAAAAEEWENARVSKYNANYQLSMAIKWVLLLVFFGLVVIALMVAAGKVDFGEMVNNWKSSIGGR